MIIRNSFLVRLGLRQSRVLVESRQIKRCLSTEDHILKSEFLDVHIPQDVSLPSFVWDQNAEKHSDRIAMVDAVTGLGNNAFQWSQLTWFIGATRFALSLRQAFLWVNFSSCSERNIMHLFPTCSNPSSQRFSPCLGFSVVGFAVVDGVSP